MEMTLEMVAVDDTVDGVDGVLDENDLQKYVNDDTGDNVGMEMEIQRKEMIERRCMPVLVIFRLLNSLVIMLGDSGG